MQKRKTRLTPQQQRFCHEYMLSGNAGSAAIQAGYEMAGSRARASRLLQKPHVKEYLEELQAEQREKYKPTIERMLTELSLLAFADPTDYVNWGNDLRELKLMPEDKRRALSEITVINNGREKQVRLKVHDKVKAMKLLAELFGLRGQPVQITASQTNTISVQASLEPVANEPVLHPNETELAQPGTK